MDAASPPPADRVPVDDDRHVAYAEYGDPAGRPVVFLHGTPGSRRLGRLFDALALAATHGDRVTSVDVVAGAIPPSLPSESPPTQRLLSRLASTTPRLLTGLFRGQAWLARVSPAVVVAQYTTTDGRASLDDDVTTLVARDFVAAFAESGRGAATELRLLAEPWSFSLDAVDSPVHLRHGARDANVPVDGARTLRDHLPDARCTVFETADHLTTLVRSRARVAERHAA